MTQLMARALRLARSTLEELPKQHAFHVEGAASLLDAPAPDTVALPTLRALLEMMEEKERMLRLLNQYIDGPGITVVIGGEHTSPDLRSFSLIASTTSDGSTIRTVGIIGPTRMHYSRAISVVDGLTQAVARVLRDELTISTCQTTRSTNRSRPARPPSREEPESPESPLETLRREKDALQDRLLRTAAEFDNYRKRVERDRREQAERSRRDALSDLLPIIDDLERALQAPSGGDVDAFRKVSS